MFRSTRSLFTGAAVVLALAGQSLFGQSAGTLPIATEFERLHFRSIGPAQASGRVSDIAGYEANPSIFYVGSAHGGVWKTTNNGATFTPQFQQVGMMSVGDLAVSQKDADLVWLGTGESNNRQSTSWGDGLWKSTDGGANWKRHMGLGSRTTSIGSSSTRRTTTSCWSPRPVHSSDRAAIAASTRRPTAAPTGNRCSRATSGPAPTTW